MKIKTIILKVEVPEGYELQIVLINEIGNLNEIEDADFKELHPIDANGEPLRVGDRVYYQLEIYMVNFSWNQFLLSDSNGEHHLIPVNWNECRLLTLTPQELEQLKKEGE